MHCQSPFHFNKHRNFYRLLASYALYLRDINKFFAYLCDKEHISIGLFSLKLSEILKFLIP